MKAKEKLEAIETVFKGCPEGLGEASIKFLIARVKQLEVALEEIMKPSYGTELCNTDEENNEILANHWRRHWEIAHKAVEGDE